MNRNDRNGFLRKDPSQARKNKELVDWKNVSEQNGEPFLRKVLSIGDLVNVSSRRSSSHINTSIKDYLGGTTRACDEPRQDNPRTSPASEQNAIDADDLQERRCCSSAPSPEPRQHVDSNAHEKLKKPRFRHLMGRVRHLGGDKKKAMEDLFSDFHELGREHGRREHGAEKSNA
ncbi:hypothetical protein K491DRAFT_719296 [Lophiostoma macrostomum CBS 122681]|uniref:Uncharacterized protein n=1 Tax=Lophiostoma macrostomum CBS 122681 TaxID=1314788 RepID=A0A6A6SWG4_9PLEO|nr:hypothetical protein K491DRAFT_719296 [Lophiostoma macrostomum CBS 122681]